VAIDDGLGFANLGQGRKLHDSSIANVIDGHTIELQLNHGRLRLMDLKIRRAVPEDALSIALVQVESWRKTYAEIVPQDFLASLDEEERAAMWKEGLQAGGMFLFVAEDEWGIFGFISGGEIREPIPGYDAELYAIYLLPARQRRGVGQELALTLREALLMESFSSMVVWALEGNLPGVSFYKRIGGIQIGQRTIEIGGAVLPELAFGWPVL
jgi:ribosomal protein S18 acetylase RimI-like enzyme